MTLPWPEIWRDVGLVLDVDARPRSVVSTEAWALVRVLLPEWLGGGWAFRLGTLHEAWLAQLRLDGGGGIARRRALCRRALAQTLDDIVGLEWSASNMVQGSFRGDPAMMFPEPLDLSVLIIRSWDLEPLIEAQREQLTQRLARAA